MSLRVCILNKNTMVCVNIGTLDSYDQWKDHGDLILAPDHTGEIGWTWNNGWIKPEPILPTLEEVWYRIRADRNFELTRTDWTQISDAPLSDAKKLEFRNYRQSLRDLPNNITDPYNVVWPTEPTI